LENSAPEWLVGSAPEVTDEIVTSRDQFITPECQMIFDWWSGFLPALPMRTEIPLSKFARFLPSIYLTELVDDKRFEVRIQGEKVKALLGDGVFPMQFSIGEPGFPGLMAHNYREAIHRKVVLRHAGTMLVIGRGHVSFESADFPINGDTVGKSLILGVIKAT
jgi:hypothetical protein